MNASVLSAFHLRPFPAETLTQFRGGIDGWGQPVTRIARAKGGEPLRDQFRRATPGEPILLGAFSPFTLRNPYREMGPVFVSAELPAPAVPELTRAPDPCAYFRATTALRAYSADQRIAVAVLVEPEEIAAQVSRYLEDPAVWFVDARFAAYGCFACRFLRTDSSALSS